MWVIYFFFICSFFVVCFSALGARQTQLEEMLGYIRNSPNVQAELARQSFQDAMPPASTGTESICIWT